MFLCKELEGQPGRPKIDPLKTFDATMWNKINQLNVRRKSEKFEER